MNSKDASLLLLGGLCYYLFAVLGMSIFSFHPSNITILWLPFGIGVILVHQFEKKALPVIFLASFWANYEGMVNQEVPYLLYLSVAAAADTLAAYLSSTLIKRYAQDHCHNVKVLLPFTLYGVLIPTFISGTIIAIDLAIGGYIPYTQICQLIILLMFSDGLGLFLLFPIYKHLDTLTYPTSAEWTSILFSLLAAFGVIWFAFEYRYLIFFLLPLLVMTAFRIRTNLLMPILLIVVIEIIALSTSHGTLFTATTPIGSIVMLMSYLITLLFVVVGVSLHNTELVTNIRLTCTDNLTQTNNLKAYKEHVAKLLSLFERHQIPFAIILFDIDDFKFINDTYGHRVGDIVLTDLASLIQKNIRTNDTLFRVGGEEFVILLSNTFLSEAKSVAEKLLAVIERDLNTIEGKCTTISIGVTQIHPNDTEDTLYRRVDALLYQSKHNGKNRITVL